MTTYACWRLWAGFKLGGIDYREISEEACNVLNQICDMPLYMKGLKVEYFSLPADSNGGIGVVVNELHWSDDIRAFDPEEMCQKAQHVLGQLQVALRESGIVAQASLMHHIDLGG